MSVNGIIIYIVLYYAFVLVIVVATSSGKQTHSEDNADSGVQFITPAGPRQSLLLAKDPNQFLWKPYIPWVYVPKPTSPNSLKLAWTKEKQDTVKVNLWFIGLKPSPVTVDVYQ